MLIPEAVAGRINGLEGERMQLRRRLGDERCGFIEREALVRRLHVLDSEIEELWDLARRARAAANPPALPEIEEVPIPAIRPTPTRGSTQRPVERPVVVRVAALRARTRSSGIQAPKRDWRRMLGRG